MAKTFSKDFLIRLREAKLLSQNDLARLSGINASSISRIEIGKAVPRLGTLQKLADALECHPDAFFIHDSEEASSVVISLSDEEYERVKKVADIKGVSPEEAAQQLIEEALKASVQKVDEGYLARNVEDLMGRIESLERRLKSPNPKD